MPAHSDEKPYRRILSEESDGALNGAQKAVGGVGAAGCGRVI